LIVSRQNSEDVIACQELHRKFFKNVETFVYAFLFKSSGDSQFSARFRKVNKGLRGIKYIDGGAFASFATALKYQFAIATVTESSE